MKFLKHTFRQSEFKKISLKFLITVSGKTWSHCQWVLRNQKLLFFCFLFFLLYQTHFSLTSAVCHLFGGVRADVCRHEDCTQLSVMQKYPVWSVASRSRLITWPTAILPYFFQCRLTRCFWQCLSTLISPTDVKVSAPQRKEMWAKYWSVITLKQEVRMS